MKDDTIAYFSKENRRRGVRMLRALGYRDARRFHMNEGHAAQVGLELPDKWRSAK